MTQQQAIILAVCGVVVLVAIALAAGRNRGTRITTVTTKSTDDDQAEKAE
nr:hypothetical protein [uncultured Sphingomonas sp.]